MKESEEKLLQERLRRVERDCPVGDYPNWKRGLCFGIPAFAAAFGIFFLMAGNRFPLWQAFLTGLFALLLSGSIGAFRPLR